MQPTHYKGVEAWCRYTRSAKGWVFEQMTLAAEENAPVSAVYRRGKNDWATLEEVRNKGFQEWFNRVYPNIEVTWPEPEPPPTIKLVVVDDMVYVESVPTPLRVLVTYHCDTQEDADFTWGALGDQAREMIPTENGFDIVYEARQIEEPS